MKVIVHFKGGLGNQLIQYAFVQKFFQDKNVEVIFDSTHFKFIGERQFFLYDFPHSRISKLMTINILLRMYIKIVAKRLYQLGIIPYLKSVLHNYIDDDIDLNKLNDINSKYLFVNGYFQHLEIFPLPSNNEFIKYLNKLSNDLKENETFNLISNLPNPIMLHLRRGDYVSNEKAKKQMGLCGFNYFKNGVDLISKDLNEYSLFVFSDDIEYAYSLFKDFKAIHFIKGDTFNPIQDFLLMRNFKYAVISNSTLSYMASMLSRYEDNIVVIPNPWFNNGQKFSLGTKKEWKYVDKY